MRALPERLCFLHFPCGSGGYLWPHRMCRKLMMSHSQFIGYKITRVILSGNDIVLFLEHK